MKKYKIYVVPHTHWDKEWYFTKEDSDILLNSNTEQILNLMDKYKGSFSFTFDGQSSILDDYANIANPNNLKRLLAYAKSKKIIFGPWYIQPDFFNVSSESIVRNLLLGIKVANEYKVDYLKTAYVPDSFGQNAQMPQIYHSFGLHRLIYWRGARKEDVQQSSYHQWKGIDGTTIDCFNLISGYWPIGMYFPYLQLQHNNIGSIALKFLEAFKAKLKELKDATNLSNGMILAPAGGDQAPLVNYWPELIKVLNKIDQEHEWLLSDYDTFFENLPKNSKLNVVEGNLLSPTFARIHRTIGSQRADIKILLKEVETLFFNNVEPLAVYVKSLGGTYTTEVFDYLLKDIISAQAHDSIGGCNADITNQNIKNRLMKALQALKSIRTQLIKSIAIQMNLKNEEFIVFNAKFNELDQAIDHEVTIFTQHQHFDILDENNQQVEYVVTHMDEPNPESLTKYYRFKIIIKNYSIPILTVKRFQVLASNKNSNLQVVPKIISKRWDITINKNGTLNIVDKVNNIIYKDQFLLTADHDAGDSYDYSPSKEHPGIISKLVSSTHTIQKSGSLHKILLTNVYEVPFNEGEHKVKQTWNLSIRINENDDLIKIRLNTKNVAKCIRWRLCSNYPFKKDEVFSNHSYCTMSHPVSTDADQAIWQKEKWPECPLPVWTNESYVYLQNKNIKSGFITCGSNCYEVINNKTSQLNLDLFRSVSYLGRRDLLSRPGRASGIDDVLVHTPEAELLTDLEFTVRWFSTKQTNIWKLALRANTQTVYYQCQSYIPTYRNFDKFVYLNPWPLNLNKKVQVPYINHNDFTITAMKKAEFSDDILVRGFNNSDKSITVKFTDATGKPVTVDSLDLLENTIKHHLTSDIIGKYQIKTYKITLK